MPLHSARHTIEDNLLVKEVLHEQSDRGHGRLAGRARGRTERWAAQRPGRRGHRVHRRAYDLEAWRERLDLAGGRTNRDDEVVREANDLVGAHVVGRRTFDEGGRASRTPRPSGRRASS